ncbi:MAG: helix-turn-helix domain-containing protein, partial [Lachnospiraceae bacterium]|nr:helix-turn-helix domain-containing protein [Lachnospiraceae bacterium]
MHYTTVGSLIKKIRTDKKITRKNLAYGICSEHTLGEIEADKYVTDILMIDILLQRLGKSPDKFEMVLSKEVYQMVKIRDLIEKMILQGKRDLAEKMLHRYPLRTNIDKMYQYRMRASLLYYIDKNFQEAADSLKRAILITLPDFLDDISFFNNLDTLLISSIEMENLLALERLNIENIYEKKGIKEKTKKHLEQYMNYINFHFAGDEEYAKLCSKCAWLLGRICYFEDRYFEVMVLCEKGLEGLRKNTILYFMLPLLELMVKAERALKIAPEQSKWMKYYEVIFFIWKGYAEKWYPIDSLFHNCYQREYHLDYELIRAERKAQEITQNELATDIYQNPESLSRVESGKVSPNKKSFEKLMVRLGIDKCRYNGYIATDSFEVMELKRTVDQLVMRRDYKEAKEVVQELNNKLDMRIAENRMVIGLYENVIEKHLGKIVAKEALEKLEILAQSFIDIETKTFSHIPMRNEVALINNICLNLIDIGQKEEALELYKVTLQKMKNSKVHIKYRYRSYALLLNNYVRSNKNIKSALEELQNELLCGKAMEFSLCLNNILQILY